MSPTLSQWAMGWRLPHSTIGADGMIQVTPLFRFEAGAFIAQPKLSAFVASLRAR